ncbi:MAG: cupin domain-containing protein [Steroidobacteraceae bacterium]|jgi:ribosomal protein L16 Arg81 hydroxylase
MDSQARTKDFDLTALLAPINPEDFFRDYWERKPLHLSRKDPHYYDTVLNNGDLESIISYPDLRYPAIQLARDGGYLAPEAFTRDIKHGTEVFAAVADLERIQSEYRAGTTVVLAALQRLWMPVQELCAALENHISHPVHANAYLTPGGFPGFTPHYDTHEVFVLQIAGTKHWRVFDPPLKLPHRSQTFSPIGYNLPAPILEFDLNPGDLLYLPRGYVHAANAVGGHSAHLTIGITVYTWVELIAELANAAKDMPALRAALPPGFAARAELKATLQQHLPQYLEQLRDNADFQRLIDGFVHRVTSARARPQPVFDSDIRAIGLQTHLRTPAAGSYRISIEPRGVVMEFADKKFVLPEKIRATIDEMCRRQSFRLAELSGPLDDDGKLTLARYLHGERFLTVLD